MDGHLMRLEAFIVKPPRLEHLTHLQKATKLLFWLWVLASLLSIVSGSVEYFPRFGAIGVIYAALYFSLAERIHGEVRAYGASIESYCLAHSAFFDSVDVTLRFQGQKKESGYQALESLAKNYADKKKNFAKLEERSHGREAIVLTVATLQWAFGDLLFLKVCAC